MATATETNNPFEFKLSREKHNVLNRRDKNARGKPGVSRSKALQKRKRTLLEEYRTRNKANEFVDRRLGEGDADMSLEDKMMARFAAERKSHHDKANIYNLNDEEELTHFGQSLAQIEKFEDPRSDDEDDEDKLGARFVKAAHFGGGFLTKRDEDQGGEREKSRQDMIDEMIAKSKQRKVRTIWFSWRDPRVSLLFSSSRRLSLQHERQSEREATDEMTEKVDAEWSNVRSLLSAFVKSDAEEGRNKSVDDYDVVVRELKFDIRAKPTDRLKTPEEIAMDEKEKLEKLETDRLLRMRGVRVDDEEEGHDCSMARTSSDHKSADDLDDEVISNKYSRRSHLTHKDGETAHDDPDVGSNLQKKVSFKDAASDDEEIGEDDDREESEESEADSYADILSESEDDSSVEANGNDEDEEPDSKVEKEHEIGTESTRMELPYTFAVPSTYEEFLDLIEGHSKADRMVILERMIKCNHPCLADGNVSKLEVLLDLLLQWTDDLTSVDEPLVDVVDGLVPVLFDLVQFSPQNAARTILEAVLKKQKQFRHDFDTSVCSTLILLKLVAILFPASDFSHEVVTPTFLFMGQILTQSAISSGRDVAVGLFVCNLFLECVSLSKRFVPEAVNFLTGCFLSAMTVDDEDDRHRLPYVHPFKPVGPSSDLLRVHGHCKEIECLPLSIRRVQRERDCGGDNFRISALHLCIDLLRRFAELYVGLPTFPITFDPIVVHNGRLPFDRLPDQIKEKAESLVGFIEQRRTSSAADFPLVTMVRERKKPKPMKLLDPIVEDRFDGRRRRNGDPAVLERQRFEHRYKREMKGAIREIRRDNKFLAGQQFVEQRERDFERKRKLRDIYRDLATQEGFCKTIDRNKKKMMMKGGK